MGQGLLPRYAIITFEVIGYADYGLLVRDVESGGRGFVDRADVADAPVRADAWPAVGERARGVVLGCSRDGRIRVHSGQAYVALVESLVDPDSAMREWVAVKRAGVADAGIRDEFFRSPNSRALIRWALGRPQGSADRRAAVELLAVAPSKFLERFAEGQES
jgi:hypothetical protein